MFIDGDVIKSSEGTTQRDPLAMPMYAIATLPLIQRLNKDGKQVWCADDAASMGKVDQVRGWLDQLVKLGPVVSDLLQLYFGLVMHLVLVLLLCCYVRLVFLPA